MKIDGSCHCGNISYEADIEPDMVTICHCTDCQALSGTAFRTIVPVAEDNITISGEPKIYIKTGDSGAKREQAFCVECGSAIYATSVGDGPKVYNMRLGTARQRHQLMPQTQVWAQSALSWLPDLPSIPSVEKQ